MSLSLHEALSKVADHRQRGGLRHPLGSFLTMITMGMLSGFHAYQELAKFLKANEGEFTELFGLKHGVPGYTQIRTILRDLNYASLYSAFHAWSMHHVRLEPGDWLSGDGKALNSTVADCHSSKQNYVAMVSLFAQKTGATLAVERYESGKKGEIPALRELSSFFAGKGILITLDAQHCQKKR